MRRPRIIAPGWRLSRYMKRLGWPTRASTSQGSHVHPDTPLPAEGLADTAIRPAELSSTAEFDVSSWNGNVPAKLPTLRKLNSTSRSIMDRKHESSAINRRNLLSGLVAVPAFLSVFPISVATLAATADDPLPSWNDTATKTAILDFVARVTTPGSADFVPEAERIATFDNDGTLWAEQPLYFAALLYARSGQGARAAASRVEEQGALRLAAERRHQGRARRAARRPCRDRDRRRIPA